MAPLAAEPGPPPPAALQRVLAGPRSEPTPYVGIEPPPSRGFAVAFQVASAAAAVASALRAVCWYQRIRIHDDLVRQGPTLEVLRELRQSDGLLALSWLVLVGTIIGGVVCDLLWRQSRRPKALRTSHGEAFVELPLSWVLPVWFRVGQGVLVAGAVLATMNGTSTRLTPATELASHDLLTAAGALGWTTVWLSLALGPVFSERAHRLRASWSVWYRAHPGSVPYVPAVAGAGTGFDDPRSEGIGWVFRTAGLVIGAMFGLVATIGALSSLPTDPAVGTIWLVIAVPVDVLIVRAFVRRRQRRLTPAPS